MEIKIYCDAKVNIDKFNSAVFVKCEVDSYRKEGETLSGEIIIEGEYYKDSFDEKYPFSEKVPFSIVFKTPNYNIEDIVIEDFNFQEIVNLGIETNFNIIIRYEIFEEDEIKIDDVEILDNDYDELVTFRDDEEDDEQEEVKEIEIIEEEQEDIKAESPIDETDLTKEQISEKYDNLLKNVLDSRTDNFFEPPKEEKSNVRIIEEESDVSDPLSFFNNMNEDYYTYRVRYINKESDLDALSKKERISIEKIYQDNKHSNFLEKRRIIIK